MLIVSNTNPRSTKKQRDNDGSWSPTGRSGKGRGKAKQYRIERAMVARAYSYLSSTELRGKTMIVERMTYMAKPGRTAEAVKMCQDFWRPGVPMITHRIYRTISGKFDEIFVEIEFEDFEARDRFYADLDHNPGHHEKWIALSDSGSSTEFLTLVE